MVFTIDEDMLIKQGSNTDGCRAGWLGLGAVDILIECTAVHSALIGEFFNNYDHQSVSFFSIGFAFIEILYSRALVKVCNFCKILPNQQISETSNSPSTNNNPKQIKPMEYENQY